MQVLVAEDSAVYRELLADMLQRWGYTPLCVADGQSALDRLTARDGPQLALVDWMLPGVDGVEICRRVRAAADLPYVYIVLITAQDGNNALVEGLDAGADDFLAKPFNERELRVRLRSGQRIAALQRELIAARDRLHFQATHDSLTDTWNRAAILDMLGREAARAGRHACELSVVMCDVDNFKAVNDTLGHPTGDLVLREVARRLRQETRPYDAVGRYGGEEFLLVLPENSVAAAERVAERVRRAVAGTPISTPAGDITVTISMGVASLRTATAAASTAGLAQETETLLALADQALYAAKRAGRNRVSVTRPPGAAHTSALS